MLEQQNRRRRNGARRRADDADVAQVVALHEVLNHSELPEDPRTGAGEHELRARVAAQRRRRRRPADDRGDGVKESAHDGVDDQRRQQHHYVETAPQRRDGAGAPGPGARGGLHAGAAPGVVHWLLHGCFIGRASWQRASARKAVQRAGRADLVTRACTRTALLQCTNSWARAAGLHKNWLLSSVLLHASTRLACAHLPLDALPQKKMPGLADSKKPSSSSSDFGSTLQQGTSTAHLSIKHSFHSPHKAKDVLLLKRQRAAGRGHTPRRQLHAPGGRGHERRTSTSERIPTGRKQSARWNTWACRAASPSSSSRARAISRIDSGS